MDAVRGLSWDGLPNLFLASTISHRPDPEETAETKPAEQAAVLGKLYRQMLDIIVPTQAALELDQERLAVLFAQAQAAQTPDEQLDVQVFLLQENIDLRLRELDEECRRLAAVERRLRRALDDAEAECEIEALRQCGLVEPRLFGKVLDQRRVLREQQQEMDHMYFERDVLADEAARMKEQLQNFEFGDCYGEEGLGVVTGGFTTGQDRQSALADPAAVETLSAQGSAQDHGAFGSSPAAKSRGPNRLVKAKAKSRRASRHGSAAGGAAGFDGGAPGEAGASAAGDIDATTSVGTGLIAGAPLSAPTAATDFM